MEELTIYPRLQGKTVLITGASAGIGEAAAYHFAACGSNLILVARRQDRLDNLATSIKSKYSVEVHIQVLNVSDIEAVKAAAKHVDILVLNAGLALSMVKLEEYDWSEVNQMIDTNVKGVITFVQAYGPDMRARNSGTIVVVSSIAGKIAYLNGSVYCATKFAVEGLTDALRQEFVDTDVRICKVSPGAVNTDFSGVRFHGDMERANSVYKGYTPLVAADVSDNIVYVASRPTHVQIWDIIVTPTAQALPSLIHRKPT